MYFYRSFASTCTNHQVTVDAVVENEDLYLKASP